MMVFIVVDLPRRIAAEQRHDLALADRVVHLLQDVQIAVVGVDVLEFKQHQTEAPASDACALRPRYARSTSSLRRTSSGLPRAITSPWSST